MHLSRRLPAMPHYLCHEQPDLLEFETSVVDARPGAVLLARSALHPGGGGQVCDTATLKHAHGVAQIIGISPEGGRYWHVLDTPLDWRARFMFRSTRNGAPRSRNSILRRTS
jgi:Ser-tRNA(Ala) deacylase AlaX